MYKNQTVYAIIPARGGSRGVPRKNIIPLNSVPLIAYTIKAAKTCAFVDRVIVTTDDNEIAAVAKEWGAEVPFIRPPDLGKDHVGVGDAIFHALGALEKMGSSIDLYFVLLPTYPFRPPEMLDAALALSDRNMQVHSCRMVDVDWSNVMTESAGTWKKITEAPRPCRYVRPSGLLSLFRLYPKGLRHWDPGFDPQALAAFINEQRRAGNEKYSRAGAGISITHPHHEIDIDEPDDLVLAQRVARSLNPPYITPRVRS